MFPLKPTSFVEAETNNIAWHDVFILKKDTLAQRKSQVATVTELSVQ